MSEAGAIAVRYFDALSDGNVDAAEGRIIGKRTERRL